MFDDDNAPQKKSAQQKALDPMSIGELKEYIADMEAEILRVRDEIEKKEKHMSAADSIFGS